MDLEELADTPAGRASVLLTGLDALGNRQVAARNAGTLRRTPGFPYRCVGWRAHTRECAAQEAFARSIGLQIRQRLQV